MLFKDDTKAKWEAMGKRVRSEVVYKSKVTEAQGRGWDRKSTLAIYDKPVEGWLVGFRNIPIVDVAWDEWTCINTVGSIHVALVAVTPFTKPEYVPLDFLEFVEDGE